jgi:hypothetical protein
MAKYKEIWESYDDSTVIGYIDTEEGGSIPLAPGNRHYRMVQEWLTAGNVADPMYTAEEIAALESANEAAQAEQFLKETASILMIYNDDIATKDRSSISTSKAKRLRRDRNRARKRAGLSIPRYTEPED